MSKSEMIHNMLTIKSRNIICLNGVINVASFDENFVILEIADGRVNIEGERLKIESLSRDGGDIEITGRIDGVFYAKEKTAKKLFRGLFA